MFKKILLPYDLSKPSQEALEWASLLAIEFKSEIKVVHAIFQEKYLVAYGLLPKKEDLIRQVDEEIRKDLQEIFNGENQDLLDRVSVEVLYGDPSELILEKIEAEDPDLVIGGTHGWTGLKHFFMGSVAEKIVRSSKAPVLTVKNKFKWPFKKLCVPIDFSEFTEDLLRLACELKQFGKPEIDLVHVVSLPDLLHYSPEISSEGRDNLQKQLQEDALQKLKAYQSKHTSLNANVKVLIGQASTEICNFAKEAGSDCILIPTHGHQGIKRFFLGSTAESVIRYAPCSTLSFLPKKMDLDSE